MRGGDPNKARGMFLRLLDLKVQMHLQKLQCPFLVEERGAFPGGPGPWGWGHVRTQESFSTMYVPPLPPF